MDKKKATELDRLLGMVKQDEEVLAVIIFGSAVRREKTALSDVDLCLVMMPLPKPSGLTGLSYRRFSKILSTSTTRISKRWHLPDKECVLAKSGELDGYLN